MTPARTTQLAYRKNVRDFNLQSKINNLKSRLVSYRLPVVPAVTRTEPIASLLVDRDALRVAPIRRFVGSIVEADLNRVSHLPQQVDRVGGKPFLHVDHIGHPLIVEARRVDRFLNVHAEI